MVLGVIRSHSRERDKGEVDGRRVGGPGEGQRP